MIIELVQYDFQDRGGTEACRAVFGNESILRIDLMGGYDYVLLDSPHDSCMFDWGIHLSR